MLGGGADVWLFGVWVLAFFFLAFSRVLGSQAGWVGEPPLWGWTNCGLVGCQISGRGGCPKQSKNHLHEANPPWRGVPNGPSLALGGRRGLHTVRHPSASCSGCLVLPLWGCAP